jgi:enoyl-[acyl-carrier protein] reductase II
MGTRFMASEECQIHQNYKKAILDATDEDVIVVARFTGHPIRLIKNKLAEGVKKMEERNPFPEEIKSERFAGAKGGDNIDAFPLLSGTCAGGINDVKTCKQIIEDIIKDAEKILKEDENILK